MRRTLMLLTIFGLMGCSNPVDDAKRELEIVQKSHGNLDDVCRAKQKLADAYLTAQDQANYQAAKLDAGGTCLDAHLSNSINSVP